MKAYKGIRRFKHIVFCVPVLLAFGCGIGNLENDTLSEKGDYHFRKTRWGYSQAMVALSEQEQGTRLFSRKGNTLIYNERISGMPVKLVYCFEKDKLRVAGYLTDRPIKNVEIFEHVAKTLGEPNRYDRWRHGLGGLPYACVYGSLCISCDAKPVEVSAFAGCCGHYLNFSIKHPKRKQARFYDGMESGHTSIKTSLDSSTR